MSIGQSDGGIFSNEIPFSGVSSLYQGVKNQPAHPFYKSPDTSLSRGPGLRREREKTRAEKQEEEIVEGQRIDGSRSGTRRWDAPTNLPQQFPAFGLWEALPWSVPVKLIYGPCCPPCAGHQPLPPDLLLMNFPGPAN